MVFANLGVSIPVFVARPRRWPTSSPIILKGHAVRAAAVRPAQLRRRGHAARRVAWGLQDLSGLPRGILDFLSNLYMLDGARSPASGGAAADAFRHLILPAIALGTIPLAIIARITRSSLLEVLGLDYMRTARAKGVDGADGVVLRHGDAQRAPAGRHRSSGSSSGRCSSARC